MFDLSDGEVLLESSSVLHEIKVAPLLFEAYIAQGEMPKIRLLVPAEDACEAIIKAAEIAQLDMPNTQSKSAKITVRLWEKVL